MHLKNFGLLALSTILFLGVIFASGCGTGESGVNTAPASSRAMTEALIKNITPQEAATLIQENKDNPDFVILDVRTPEEYAEGHIENSINIDFYADTFRKDINNLDKSKTYLVYCRSGSRSFSSAGIMLELNFQNVYNMMDGLIRWRAEGLPLVR